MTEEEWLQATDPQPMLEFLQGKVSERKLRLFAIACCRRIWHVYTDERSRRAVEVAERHVEGLADLEEVMAAWGPAWEAANDSRELALGAEATSSLAWDVESAAAAAGHALAGAPVAAANAAWGAIHNHGGAAAESADLTEQRHQAELLRELVGVLPFRPITIDPSWLTWHDGLLVSMAQKMYDSRDFSDMPVLADALEEAGCVNPDILGHCRSKSDHVRGCWLVDLLLNKA